eukprot:PhM_4_TR13977/c5_g1_i1/m.15642
MSDDERDPELAEEEEEEEEDVPYEPIETDEMPNGERTLFVGGFSTLPRVSDALTELKDGESTVVVLPGEYNELVQLDKPVKLLGSEGSAPNSVVMTKGMVTQRTASGSIIRDVTIKHGLEVGQQSNVVFVQCQMIGSVSEAVVSLHANQNATFTDCVIESDAPVAVYCYPRAGGQLENCTIKGKESTGPKATTVGVVCHDSSTNFVKCTITGAATSVFASGAGVEVAEGENPVRSTFEECKIDGASVTGALLDGATVARLIKTTVGTAGRYCIRCTGNAKPIIRECVVVGGDVRVAPTSRPGMLDNIIVKGNVCMDNAALAVTGFTHREKVPPPPPPPKVEEEE